MKCYVSVVPAPSCARVRHHPYRSVTPARPPGSCKTQTGQKTGVQRSVVDLSLSVSPPSLGAPPSSRQTTRPRPGSGARSAPVVKAHAAVPSDQQCFLPEETGSAREAANCATMLYDSSPRLLRTVGNTRSLYCSACNPPPPFPPHTRFVSAL